LEAKEGETNLVKFGESGNSSRVEEVLSSSVSPQSHDASDTLSHTPTRHRVRKGHSRNNRPTIPTNPHSLNLHLSSTSFLTALLPFSFLSTPIVNLQPPHKPFLHLLASSALPVRNDKQRARLLSRIRGGWDQGKRCGRESTDDATAQAAVMFSVGEVEGGAERREDVLSFSDGREEGRRGRWEIELTCRWDTSSPSNPPPILRFLARQLQD